MEEFKDKVVFISGGSTGLGKAVAIAFAKQKAKLILTCRRVERAKELVDYIQKELGTEVLIESCDVSKSDQVEKVINLGASRFGQINYAVNNAGIVGEAKTLDNYSEEIWDKVVNTNLKGTFLCMKYQIPHLLKQKNSAIVNISSVMGLVGTPFLMAPYSATKHGIIGLTKSVAIEYGSKGLRINAVCPGVIKTESYEKMFDAKAQGELEKLHPTKRVALPEEVANAVLWLCSSYSSFITGSAITVDGGYTAQ
ncbi:MAG: SDR family oxidoreductase [Leptospiraceae bacterium]|nr:SDR family oxidoreductase [Leptospiraceae bacterium]MCP5494633.1 SDR family oxidoreductase [Leptospiraceae bacterium]